MDDIDLSHVRLETYRTQLGIVLQETFLFDGTIRDNVSFSRPDASEDDIMAACRIARVDEFAESFELKYDTIIGERGVKLSGGQRQRISIARAILADPRILILDEATSSLDSESEAMIQQGLSYLMRGRTTFVIAHRLSTIRRADQILVVESGRIIERGNHKSLYALAGRYFDLYTKQHGLETNLFLAPGEGGTSADDPAQRQRRRRSRAERRCNHRIRCSPRRTNPTRHRVLARQDARRQRSREQSNRSLPKLHQRQKNPQRQRPRIHPLPTEHHQSRFPQVPAPASPKLLRLQAICSVVVRPA